MKEIRYLLEVKNFDKIPSKYKENYKIDWYFHAYRIRHSYSIPEIPKLNGWYKIDNSESGNSVKKKIRIKKPDRNTIDDMKKTALFYTISDGKFFHGLYIEEVKLYIGNILLEKFYTTEAETDKDKNNIEQLKSNDHITKIIKLGEVSMRDICTKYLSNNKK